jgi:hypothetical protein
MKTFLQISVIAPAILLDGCYAPLIEGAQEGYDAIRRDSLQAETSSGNPVDMYKLGDTYCCHGGGPMDQVSIYDNNKATYWYCRAARQGYGPAQLRLAQIYSGHPIHGLHITLRASALVGAATTDIGTALMWATIAADRDVEAATAIREQTLAIATEKQRAKGATLMKNWRTAPCSWAEVFPPGRN